MLSGINVTVPTITKLLVSFEKWDFPEYNIKQEIWRNYLIQFINLTIFVLLSYDGFYDISLLNEFLGTSFPSEYDFSQSTTCVYDTAGIALFQVIISELFVLFFAQSAKAIFNKVFKGMLLKKEWKQDRGDFLSDFVIWMLYNKSVMWLTILEMPYFVLIAPFIDYLSFSWIYYVLKNFYRKGNAASDDVGLFLMIIMLCSFFYFQLLLTPWVIQPRYHGCGPILNNQSGWDPILHYITTHEVAKWIYELLTFFPLLWITSILALNLGFIQGNFSSITKEYSKDKIIEFKEQVKDN